MRWSASDQLTIRNWFVAERFKIERFGFNDEEYLSATEIEALIPVNKGPLNWYASTGNRSVVNLPVIAQAMAEFDATATDSLLSKKIQQFSFLGLVERFDQGGAVSNWGLTNALLDFHNGGAIRRRSAVIWSISTGARAHSQASRSRPPRSYSRTRSSAPLLRRCNHSQANNRIWSSSVER